MITTLLMAPAGAQSSPIAQFLPLILIGLVFYFFIIRPQTKKAKEAKKFRESLNKGDKIITIGGIHGKIVEMKDTNVVIEVEGGGKLRIERSAISPELTTGSGLSTLQQPGAAK